VEKALRDVQQPALADAQPPRLREQRGEVTRRRLVRADVLGGQDAAEPDAQTAVTRGERLPVDVGQDDELVPLAEGRERVTLLSSGEELPACFDNGYVDIVVPEIGVYEVLKIGS